MTTTPNVNVALAEQRQPLARRRSLVLALAGGAALASLPARAQSTAGGKGDILIGRSTALSGGMAPFLSPIHEGQEAAVEDANAKGGIGGRKIRLVSLDDGVDPRRTLESRGSGTKKTLLWRCWGCRAPRRSWHCCPTWQKPDCR